MSALSPPDPAPVDLWEPPLSGEMPLCITAGGDWIHQGRKIEREALVRLFASILRCDADGHHYLVTPVEKWRIRVEDAPFVAVDLHRSGDVLTMVTNMGERVGVDHQHPLAVEKRPDGQPVPYVLVRGRLRARLSRNVFYHLVELAVAEVCEGREVLAVYSAGCRFVLGETGV